MRRMTWNDIPEELLRDHGYRGALWILMELWPTEPDVWRFVDLQGHSIFFDDMLAARPWSAGETLLLQTAQSLFDGETQVCLWELVARLDSRCFAAILGAIAFSRRNSIDQALVVTVAALELDMTDWTTGSGSKLT